LNRPPPCSSIPDDISARGRADHDPGPHAELPTDADARASTLRVAARAVTPCDMNTNSNAVQVNAPSARTTRNNPDAGRQRLRKLRDFALGAGPRRPPRSHCPPAAPLPVAAHPRVRDNAGSVPAAVPGHAHSRGNAVARTSAATAAPLLGKPRCSTAPAAGTDETTARIPLTDTAGTETAGHQNTEPSPLLDPLRTDVNIAVDPREFCLLPTVKPRREALTSLRGASQPPADFILPSASNLANSQELTAAFQPSPPPPPLQPDHSDHSQRANVPGHPAIVALLLVALHTSRRTDRNAPLTTVPPPFVMLTECCGAWSSSSVTLRRGERRKRPGPSWR
jgi:hypothetical protein